jgi:predicted RNase H-like nuclease (RuvC/YqgF family)
MATFIAKRANKILRISGDSIEKYIVQGYTITDEQGNLVRKGTPHNANQLTAEYKKQEVEIASLKKENNALKEENKTLRAEVKSLKAEIVKIKSETPVSAEPKQTRKKKQTTSEEVKE